ncbi:hypothetical protein [Frankia sp. Cppng1_Ct_nod]|uniref:hypothetical protein n=1 Tax=Frankia sp. Cppng1_Ct_nod TaxID=2897162 RepID=UPI001041AEF0|nr:hypothetical protein [Frankia sp. Cppng1_Ct_nod]
MERWQPHAAALAHELATLHDYDVIVDNPDPTSLRVQVAAGKVHPAWLIDAFGRLAGSSRLRLRRRTDLDALTVQTARDLFLDLCARGLNVYRFGAGARIRRLCSGRSWGAAGAGEGVGHAEVGQSKQHGHAKSRSHRYRSDTLWNVWRRVRAGGSRRP